MSDGKNNDCYLKIIFSVLFSYSRPLLTARILMRAVFISNSSYKIFVDACLVANSVFSVINDNCFHDRASFR